MKKTLFVLFLLALTSIAMAQTVTVRGTVIDADTKETLVGASIYHAATKTGTTANLDGTFSLTISGSPELTISYMGYITQVINFAGMTNPVIELQSDVVSLKGVNIVADQAVSRKTPVAVSTITPIAIEERLGTQEFPEILKSTPGIYATKQGGGYGDSRVNLRGFESANIAMMINGVPMNDMEWGGVYWANWAGLADVTRSMQVQRGLGASKVAAPSVGGSINILTRTTDAVRGGFVSYGIGNDGYNKAAFSVSTGLTKKGWSVSLMGSKTWGDGYILGTEFSGYSYFGNVSKEINKNHLISLTAFGAPQWHNQRSNTDRLLIGEWEKYKEKYRFNPTYGFGLDGQRKTADYNYYHKPQISLNHYWTIDNKSSLSTALYVSIGRGGGYGGQGNNRTDLRGTTGGLVNTNYRTAENFFDYAKLMNENAANPNGSQAAISESINEHNWYGLLSTYTTKLGKYIDFYGGLDLRYYEGLHTAKLVDLMGGRFLIDPTRANKNFRGDARNTQEYLNEKLGVGDIVYRDNTGYVVNEGLFAQAEFNKDAWSAFVAGSISNNTYWKVDRFYYDNEKSAVRHFLGWNGKGGVNYNINKNHNVFANIGYISRAPFMSGGVFLAIHTSNGMNPDPQNEKIFSKEIGYGFRSSFFSGNVNVYHTNWNDKTLIRSIDPADPDKGVANLSGVNALHQGIEIDFTALPFKNFEIKGMFSFGDWRWKNNVEGYIFNKDGQAVDKNGNSVDAGSADHAKVALNMEGIHVGNSAQFIANIGVNYAFFEGFKAGLDYQFYGNNFANFNISNNIGNNNIFDPWKIPDAHVFDLFVRYQFKIGGLRASITGNVNNLFNAEYITDATDGSSHDWTTASVFYGFGRTMSLSFKINF